MIYSQTDFINKISQHALTTPLLCDALIVFVFIFIPGELFNGLRVNESDIFATLETHLQYPEKALVVLYLFCFVALISFLKTANFCIKNKCGPDIINYRHGFFPRFIATVICLSIFAFLFYVQVNFDLISSALECDSLSRRNGCFFPNARGNYEHLKLFISSLFLQMTIGVMFYAPYARLRKKIKG